MAYKISNHSNTLRWHSNSEHTRLLLPIPNFPHNAVIVQIFPELQIALLISFGQLCDAGCNVTLNKQELTVYLQGQKIPKGSRNLITKMLGVKNMSTDTKHIEEFSFLPSTNNTYCLSTTSSVIAYLHEAEFSSQINLA